MNNLIIYKIYKPSFIYSFLIYEKPVFFPVKTWHFHVLMIW